MRVLTAEEVQALERASVPVERRAPPVVIAGPPPVFTRLLNSGHVTRTAEPYRVNDVLIRHHITPRGLLALRIHRAYLESGGGR